LGAAFTGAQVYFRSRRLHSGISDEMLRMAVEQFLPAIAAGLLLTVVLVSCAPAECWMLPGLWQIVFSLGVFSSCRFLPREMLAAGVWYLASGLLCVSLGDGRALAPLAMGIPFGVGQVLVAAILLHAQRGETR
jgi:ABC-type methionine transport system permease subunit